MREPGKHALCSYTNDWPPDTYGWASTEPPRAPLSGRSEMGIHDSPAGLYCSESVAYGALMLDLPPTPSLRDGIALDVLERVLIKLLEVQGVSGGSLHSQRLSLEELAARDGGLPLFVAQAAVWAQVMGVSHILAPVDIVQDEAALTCTRAVIVGSGESQECRLGAPLLLFMDHAVHVARAGSVGLNLALETLIQSPSSSISNALSARRWPTHRAI
jgi:hypothetical protein